MANSNVTQPRIPAPPAAYDQGYMNQMLNVLRMYFTQLDNNGPLQGTTLNLSTINQVTGAQTIILPTQASLSSLRVGDIYYDTSAGNVLKIKT